LDIARVQAASNRRLRLVPDGLLVRSSHWRAARRVAHRQCHRPGRIWPWTKCAARQL